MRKEHRMVTMEEMKKQVRNRYKGIMSFLISDNNLVNLDDCSRKELEEIWLGSYVVLGPNLCINKKIRPKQYICHITDWGKEPQISRDGNYVGDRHVLVSTIFTEIGWCVLSDDKMYIILEDGKYYMIDGTLSESDVEKFLNEQKIFGIRVNDQR